MKDTKNPKESYTVKVIDKLEGQILYECPLEKQDLAFEYAKQMEELGLDVDIQSPSVPESLARSLGAKSEDLAVLRDEIIDEIDSHGQDCCSVSEKNSEQGEVHPEMHSDPPSSEKH